MCTHILYVIYIYIFIYLFICILILVYIYIYTYLYRDMAMIRDRRLSQTEETDLATAASALRSHKAPIIPGIRA